MNKKTYTYIYCKKLHGCQIGSTATTTKKINKFMTHNV